MSDATIIMLIGMAGWALGFGGAMTMWRAVADRPELERAPAMMRGFVMMNLVSDLPAGHPARGARLRAVAGFLVFVACIVALFMAAPAGSTTP